MMLKAAFASFTLLLLAAAPATALPPPPGEWQSGVLADHPLVGTLWNVAEARPAEPEELARAAANADFALLGEKHDNPDHHSLQAWVLEAMIAEGARPAVVFEMIREDQADALRDYLADDPEDAAGLGAAVGWEERGWPDWSMYQPIAEVALAAGLPLRAGDIGREMQQAVARDGLAALPDAVAEALALDRPLPGELTEALRQHLYEAHCELVPKEALGPMMKVQRLRDAALADSLAAAVENGSGRAALIAGGGHARADWGVAWYLRARLDGPEIVTLAIHEVQEGVEDWRAYASNAGEAEAPVYDYVWFTPRADDRDHCAELAERMKSGSREAE